MPRHRSCCRTERPCRPPAERHRRIGSGDVSAAKFARQAGGDRMTPRNGSGNSRPRTSGAVSADAGAVPLEFRSLMSCCQVLECGSSMWGSRARRSGSLCGHEPRRWCARDAGRDLQKCTATTSGLWQIVLSQTVGYELNCELTGLAGCPGQSESSIGGSIQAFTDLAAQEFMDDLVGAVVPPGGEVIVGRSSVAGRAGGRPTDIRSAPWWRIAFTISRMS